MGLKIKIQKRNGENQTFMILAGKKRLYLSMLYTV